MFGSVHEQKNIFLISCRYKHISSLTTHLKRHFKMSILILLLHIAIHYCTYLQLHLHCFNLSHLHVQRISCDIFFNDTKTFTIRGFLKSRTRESGPISSLWSVSSAFVSMSAMLLVRRLPMCGYVNHSSHTPIYYIDTKINI